MDARNRSLAEWFTRIASGQVQLPRFQRFEACGHREIDEDRTHPQLPSSSSLPSGQCSSHGTPTRSHSSASRSMMARATSRSVSVEDDRTLLGALLVRSSSAVATMAETDVYDALGGTDRPRVTSSLGRLAGEGLIERRGGRVIPSEVARRFDELMKL
jgi:hypothetical protein